MKVQAQAPHEATRVARFLVQAVQAEFGTRWNQGPRKPAWPLEGEADAAVALLCQRRLCGVSEPAAQAVWAWHQGQRPVHLLTTIPSAREVLRLQAEGQRCVSLLPDDVALAHGDPRHPNGLAFALHDLCHLEKFVDPEHHVGQVGFFARLEAAMSKPGWAQLESELGDLWRSDRDYVLADMNGSAIFLFAALKMKLKMAMRRHVGRAAGATVACGPLLPAERAAYEPRRNLLLDLLGLPPAVTEAARFVSARRTHPEAAAALLTWFEGEGRQALASKAGMSAQL